ncbi:MAG: TerD family protein [Streptosporangiaceae bacterium]
MVKGGNIGLAGLSETDGPVTLTLGWTDPTGAGEADVSVLLLGPDGRVRGDDDFFFYNQPASADGSVQLLGKSPTGSGSEDQILLDLTALPEEIERVGIAASRYAGATFGQLDDLRLTLSDSAGAHLLAFDITDAGVESAFVFGELYRRAGEWRFRAIGQGYESGLAGLARDFGISVNDDTDEPVVEEAVAVLVEAEAKQPAKVRTSRTRTVKKTTLPKTLKVSLADHASWQQARLFSASGLRNDQEREVRATSTLLAAMVQVPEFGRRLTARFNAPAGTVQTFAEASFKHGESTVRPDGIIRVARAGRIWTALVETKTGGNPLKTEQVESYLEVAARNGYETVITLSNDLALDGEHPLTVDKRKLKKVALRHLSWAEVAHEAHMLCHHDGLANSAHAWLLGELLYYLGHDNAGCQGFQNMGSAWVPVRNSITEGTLRPGDRRAVQVAENWEKLIRQLCLRLGGETGLAVAPVLRHKRGGDPSLRREQTVASLIGTGRMIAEIRIPGAAGLVMIGADLRTGQIELTIEVPAAARARALTRVQWLLRQLTESPGDLRVEALTAGDPTGPCELLKNLRAEPGLLVPDGQGEIAVFRLTLPTGMGTKRGTEETSFIRSVDAAVDRFHREVVQALKPITADQ